MKSRRFATMVGGVVLLAEALGGISAATDTGDPSESVVLWASSQARPLSTVAPGSGLTDLEPLRAMIGDARVVMLGDSRHDAREQFLLKHRMIEFLVEEMGFSQLALEESAPQAYAIHDYILGGEGDPEVLLDQAGGWYIWNTAEILALIRWLRAHNDLATSRGGARVGFHGLDITDAGHAAITNVLTYLRSGDPALTDELQGAIDSRPLEADFWPRIMANYGQLSEDAVAALGHGIDRLAEVLAANQGPLVARSDAATFERMQHQAGLARRAHELFAASRRGYVEAGLLREEAMVENLVRLIDQRAAGERIIVWAANPHVARGSLDLDIPGAPPARDMQMMGQLLTTQTRAEVVTIGFAFGHGIESHGDLPPADAQSLDGVLARVGLPRFVLDLRRAPKPGPVDAWLHGRQAMRVQGGRMTLCPAEAFDILVFTESVTRTQLTARARARLEAPQQR